MTVRWTVRADPDRARRRDESLFDTTLSCLFFCRKGFELPCLQDFDTRNPSVYYRLRRMLCMSLSCKVVLVHRPHIPQLVLCAVQVAVGVPGAASAAPIKNYILACFNYTTSNQMFQPSPVPRLRSNKLLPPAFHSPKALLIQWDYLHQPKAFQKCR